MSGDNMAAAQLMLPANRAFSSNGLPMAGAVAKLYTTGTLTPQPFYADAGLSVSLGTSLTANGAGRLAVPAYQNTATPFRLRLEDATGAEIDDIDPFYFGQSAITVNSNETTPEMYGAVANGTTNDHAAIQAAIDAVVALGGGTVKFGPKTYLCSTALTWSGAPVLLKGSGSSDQTATGTILKFPAGLSGAVNPKNGSLGKGQGSGLEDITIEGTGLVAVSDANAINGLGAGILFQCNSWRANNVVVRGFEGHGVLVRSGLTVADVTINANGGTADRLHTINNLKAGYAAEGVDSNVCLVTNLVSYGNVDGIYDNSRVGNNTYDTPLFAECSGWAVRFGANSAGQNHVRNAYSEIDITNLVKFETGSTGHNRVEFAVGTGTITDNSSSQTNTVEVQGVKTLERFGPNAVVNIKVESTQAVIQNSCALVFKDTGNLSTWQTSNGGGNLVTQVPQAGMGYYIFTGGSQRFVVQDDGLHVTGVGAISGALTAASVAATGAVTAASVASTGAVTSSSASAGIGYATGAGGTAAQSTSKATTVSGTNKRCVDITLNAAALAASTTVSFTFTNTSLVATDNLIINHISGGTFGSYTFNGRPAAGSATIDVRNVSLGSLSEAIVIRITAISGATS